MSFSRPTKRIPALLGDGLGNVRIFTYDFVACRVGDINGMLIGEDTGIHVIAILSVGDMPANRVLPDGTPIVLIYDGTESPVLPVVDADMLPAYIPPVIVPPPPPEDPPP
jgi:hypothetical protein